MRVDNRGSWSLLALLVVVAIIVVWAALYFGKSGGTGLTSVQKNNQLVDSKSKKNTVFGQAIDTGKAQDCRERLRQIRLGIETYKTTDEGNPRTLKDVGLSVGPDYFECPMSKQPYTYDPATGTVHCPTHNDF
jgi:hypothetical protein